jgi:hypothetical protein
MKRSGPGKDAHRWVPQGQIRTYVSTHRAPTKDGPRRRVHQDKGAGPGVWEPADPGLGWDVPIASVRDGSGGLTHPAIAGIRGF